MSNEFKHDSVGGELSRAEWEAIGTHVFNNQAIGDLAYAPSATQLSRLPIGIANQVLQTAGGIPTWASTLAGLTLTSPNINGVIGTTGLTIPAFTLSGKLTAGASEIEGSAFDIDGGDISAVTISGDLTWNVAQTGVTLTAPAINGIVTTTGLTIPAFTLGGKLTAGASEIEGSAFDINGGTMAGVTLDGTLTLGGQVFDAGAGKATINTTGAGVGAIIVATNNTSNGATLELETISTSIAVADNAWRYNLWGNDGAGVRALWSQWLFRLTNVGNGTEAMEWRVNLMNAGAVNDAMILSGAGGLSVDADIGTADDPVALFDSFDDALILRQGIQQGNRELLVDMGVFTKKDTGSGYMMNIQPMTRLLAGGIYQNRAKVDDIEERLSKAGI